MGRVPCTICSWVLLTALDWFDSDELSLALDKECFISEDEGVKERGVGDDGEQAREVEGEMLGKGGLDSGNDWEKWTLFMLPERKFEIGDGAMQ